MLKRLSEFIIRFKWFIVAFWLAFFLVVFFTAPSLSSVAKSSQESFLPDTSENAKASKLIKELFPDRGGKSSLLITIERNDGINDQDKAYGKKLEEYLNTKKDEFKIGKIMSPITNQEFESQMSSKDKKAFIIKVDLNAQAYADTTGDIVVNIRNDIKPDKKLHTSANVPIAPEGLSVYMTGDAPMAKEQKETVDKSMMMTGIITVILVALVLILIYRSPIAPIIPLFTIGLSFLISRGVVASISNLGLKISSFTEMFLIAVLFGAGTDYCLLMISRFREELATGKSKQDALRATLPNTGEAIISSAGTVMVGFTCMVFAKFGLFNTTGPSVAIGVGITLLAVMLLTPAILAIFGESIFWPAHPSKIKEVKKESKYWYKLSLAVTSKPMRYILVCLIVFTPLLISAVFMNRSFDLLNDMPSSADSVKGFTVLKNHFDQGEISPINVVIKTNKDMWSSESLQIVDRIAENISKIDDVAKVRTATRPAGEKVVELSLPYQVGKLSSGLEEMNSKLGPGLKQFGELQDGMKQMADGVSQGTEGLDKLSDATGQTISGISHINDGLESMRDGTGSAASGLNKISGGLDSMGTGVGQSQEGIEKVNTSLQDAQKKLESLLAAHPELATDPNFQVAYGTVKGVTGNMGSIDTGLGQVKTGLSGSKKGIDSSGKGLSDIKGGLNKSISALSQMQVGLEQVKDGQDKLGSELVKVSDGLKQIVSKIDEQKGGFDQLESGINSMNEFTKDYAATKNTSYGEFYLPPNTLENNPELRDAMKMYISKDGKGVTFDVILSIAPYSTEALDKITEINRIVADTIKKTGFDGAEYHLGGSTSASNEVRNITASDSITVMFFVLLGIFIVLSLLLRSLVAPVYLLFTIIVSYATTLGICHLFFEVILGKEGLSWSTPFFTFCLLVALGVDYNIFLMSRVKEEYRPGDVSGGVARALTSTGGIITSCGVIMAGTFGAMMSSAFGPMVEIGFATVVGILLDTFIVRCLMVPAIAVKVGELNWWPGRKVKIIPVIKSGEKFGDNSETIG